jgi:hypothetical protein
VKNASLCGIGLIKWLVRLGGVGVLVPCGVWSHLPGLNFFLSFFPLKLVHCFSQRSYLIDYIFLDL